MARGLQASISHVRVSGKTKSDKFALACARLSAQFAREDVGRYMHVDELSGHAFALTRSAAAALTASRAGGDAAHHVEAARRVAHQFRADLVTVRGRAGLALALRFSSGSFSAPGGHIFFVL